MQKGKISASSLPLPAFYSSYKCPDDFQAKALGRMRKATISMADTTHGNPEQRPTAAQSGKEGHTDGKARPEEEQRRTEDGRTPPPWGPPLQGPPYAQHWRCAATSGARACVTPAESSGQLRVCMKLPAGQLDGSAPGRRRRFPAAAGPRRSRAVAFLTGAPELATLQQSRGEELHLEPQCDRQNQNSFQTNPLPKHV